jgi:hypothetical protein
MAREKVISTGGLDKKKFNDYDNPRRRAMPPGLCEIAGTAPAYP